MNGDSRKKLFGHPVQHNAEIRIMKCFYDDKKQDLQFCIML